MAKYTRKKRQFVNDYTQIVDSIIALFRCDYSGRGELAERQQKLGLMLNRLLKISEEYNVAVYVTNQMCADPGGIYGIQMFLVSEKFCSLSNFTFTSWTYLCSRSQEACWWTYSSKHFNYLISFTLHCIF
jgi:hypothetical protein